MKEMSEKNHFPNTCYTSNYICSGCIRIETYVTYCKEGNAYEGSWNVFCINIAIPSDTQTFAPVFDRTDCKICSMKTRLAQEYLIPIRFNF